MPAANRFQAAVTALLSRNSRRLAVVAVALSLVMPLAGACPAAASLARSAHPAPRGSHGTPEVTLARAPAALQAAVRRAVGSAAPARGPVQQAKLTASDGMPGEALGISVAISGSTAIVGADDATGRAGKTTGAAYVFVRAGTTWFRQARLPALRLAANDEFGSSVAISGSTAIVGAPGVHSYTGAAYVFVRAGTKWSQQAKLTAADGVDNDGLGISVALSGCTAIVGASGRNVDTGAAYAFVRTGTAWSQRAELIAADATTRDEFGGSVAISGSTIVVGADFSNVGSNVNAGAAYVFVRGSWAQEAKLTASDGGRGDVLGTSVAVTKATVASGPTVVAGAPGNKLNTGAAYVYVLPG